MNDNHDENLIRFLKDNAPNPPVAPSGLEARVTRKVHLTTSHPFAAAFATAAVLALGIALSISGKQPGRSANEAEIARQAIVEAALGFEASEQAENSEEISEDLFGEWLSLAATVAQN